MSDEEKFPLARAEVFRTFRTCESRANLLGVQLIAFFLESMIFGAFTVLYAIAIWILLYREKKRSRSRLNKMLFTTSTVMWVLSVAVRTLPISISVHAAAKCSH